MDHSSNTRSGNNNVGLLEITPHKLEFPSGLNPYSVYISLANNSNRLVVFQLEFARMGLYRCQRQSGAVWPGKEYRLTITRDAIRVREELMLLEKQIEGLTVLEAGLKKDLIKGVDVQRKVIDNLQDDYYQQDMLLGDGEIRLYTVVLSPYTFTVEYSSVREVKLPIVYLSTGIVSKLSSLPGRLFHSSESSDERRKKRISAPFCLLPHFEINPGQIIFPFELNTNISCSVLLTNFSPADTVAYIFTASMPGRYSVRPPSGTLDPKTSCEIIFTMQAQETAPPNLECNDMFFLRIISLLSADIRRFESVNSVKLELVHELRPPQPNSLPVLEGSLPTRQELIMNLSRIFKKKSSAWTTKPQDGAVAAQDKVDFYAT